MAGETVITIVGNLTADPELRTTRDGGAVANFSIAATPRVYDRQSDQWVDGDALFLRCTAWRDLAAHCANSLAKGMRVIAQGRLQQRSYQAQDGSNRTVIELQVDEIGPSLRYATAQVRKMQSGGYQGGNANGGGYQQPQQAWQQSQTPADDPWSTPAEESEF
ncbi:MAG: single-stranded DNA-binding protein [Bifidobacterium bifidum]|nr:single-stranded DNA-binding protein [Bifidobacterium bifidum]